MNPKLFKAMIIILVSLTVIGIGTLFLVLKITNDDASNGEVSLDKMVEYSFTTSEMNTDLKDGSFVRIQFQIITDSKQAKEEIQKREFQFKNIFIKESVQLSEQDLKTGLTQLEEKLRNSMNQQMEKGQILDVYIINKIIQ